MYRQITIHPQDGFTENAVETLSRQSHPGIPPYHSDVRNFFSTILGNMLLKKLA
jgi:hypothetical protein